MNFSSFYILFFLLLTYALSGQELESILAEAKTAESNQDFISAYDFYVKALALDKKNMISLKGAGAASLKQGDTANAKKHFSNLLELDSLNRNALVALSSIYDQELNSAKASKYYKLLNDIEPQNGVFYRKHANQYYRTGYLSDAYRLYEKAHALNPKDILTIKSMAEIQIALGTYERADSLLLIGFALDSSNVSLLLLKSKNNYRLKDYEQTVSMLLKVNRSTNLDNYYMKMLGFSYMQVDSIDKAIQWLERSLHNESNPEYAHYYLAKAYREKEDLELSIHHYEKAAASGVSDNMKNYHQSLAKIYEEKKELKKAIRHFDKAYSFEKDPILLYHLALAYDQYYADKTIAVKYFDRYLKSGHDHVAYLQYALERRDYLIEIAHLKK